LVANARPITPEPWAQSMSAFPNYGFVALAHDVTSAGVKYPAGTRGVIVLRHDDGVGYEVEFERPRFGVVTLTAADLIAA